jgi:tyrosine aminotransferase
MQRALPAILANTPEKFYVDTMNKLEATGKALHARLNSIEGLNALLPQGAMYLMCGGLENFEFANDKAFVEALHEEERVFILPGACFRLDGYMRFVTTTPLPILLQACDRIEAFCNRHRKTSA